ncbi:MAG: hypothetical protein ACPG52_07795 [Cognaticolwellia sp.]
MRKSVYLSILIFVVFQIISDVLSYNTQLKIDSFASVETIDNLDLTTIILIKYTFTVGVFLAVEVLDFITSDKHKNESN